jgi:MoaA/NifB/PqqE/SkfB family radical SAM enzyme
MSQALAVIAAPHPAVSPGAGGSVLPHRFVLPSAVCFRITRSCNAHCRFCLAPPDGSYPDYATLLSWSDWLIDRGVRRIEFCGGEPTIHPALPKLLAHVNSRAVKTALTTNGLEISPALPPLLRVTGTSVRVSLHGGRLHHDELVGDGCFDRTVGNLRRLLDAGLPCSIQATAVAGGSMALDWLISFSLEQRVRRLGVLPFIARGAGRAHREELGLCDAERSALRELVRDRRKRLSGRLDLRWLDLASKRVPVLEPDGRLLLEGVTEAGDRLLCRLR